MYITHKSIFFTYVRIVYNGLRCPMSITRALLLSWSQKCMVYRCRVPFTFIYLKLQMLQTLHASVFEGLPHAGQHCISIMNVNFTVPLWWSCNKNIGTFRDTVRNIYILQWGAHRYEIWTHSLLFVI